MSYTTPDFADDIIEQLTKDGYRVHGEDDGDLAGLFWFTWAKDGADIESGDHYVVELGAWSDALAHRLANSSIQLHKAADPGDIVATLHYSEKACRRMAMAAADSSVRSWCDIIRWPLSPEGIPCAFEADIIDGPVMCDHPEIEAAEIGRFTCDVPMILAGIRRLLRDGAEVHPAIRNDVLLAGADDEHDLDGASIDAIVQFGVFGEMVF